MPTLTSYRQVGRSRRQFLGALLVALMTLSGGVALGQEEPQQVQARSLASAEALRIIVSRPGTAPIEPPVDVILGWANGEMDDLTGSARSLASAAYPGATISRPKGLFGLLGFPVGGQVFEEDHPVTELYASIPSLLPAYPLLVEANKNGTPSVKVDLVGEVLGQAPTVLPFGVEAAVQEAAASQNLVQAKTTFGGVTVDNALVLVPGVSDLLGQLQKVLEPFVGDVPGLSGSLFDAASMTSETQSLRSDGGTLLTTEASTDLSDITFLGGLVTVGHVKSGTSYSGRAAGSERGSLVTEVEGIRVLGLEVAVDHNGFRVADERIPRAVMGTAEDLLDQLLRELGVELHFMTVDEEAGTADAVRVRAVLQEPEVPGVTPIGRTTTVTMIVGHVAAGQATTAAPAPTAVPGLSTGTPTTTSPRPQSTSIPQDGDSTGTPPDGSTGVANSTPISTGTAAQAPEPEPPEVAAPNDSGPDDPVGAQPAAGADEQARDLQALADAELAASEALQDAFLWLWLAVAVLGAAMFAQRRRHAHPATASFRGDEH